MGVVAAAVGTSTHLDAGIRDPGASWSDPAELARLRVIARPRVAMSSGAGAYVAAVEGFGRRTRLRVYTHGDGGGWRPVEGPPGTSEGVGDVALALAGDGRPAIAWLHRAPQGATTLLASARDGDGWSPPADARPRPHRHVVRPDRRLLRARRGRRGMEPVGSGSGPGSRSAQPP